MRERVAELCRRLAPVIPDLVQSLWSAYVADASTEGQSEIEQTLELLAARHLGSSYVLDRQPFPPPPRAWAQAGEIPMGQVMYGGKPQFPLLLPVEALKTHALVCGRSGSGKSVLTMHLARALMRRDIVVTCFDWKRSYRELIRHVPEGTLRVYTPGRESVAPLRWNPLIPPPGCEPMLYGKLIVDVICRALLGGEGVISLLHRGVEALYTECGVMDGRPERYPTIADLLGWVERTKLSGRAALWKSSADRILRAMTYGDFGRMMDTQSSADLLTILDCNTVIELDGLSGSADRQLFAEGATLWMSRYLLARGETPHLERAWIHEEAHHLLSQGDTGTQETVLEQALRLIRAYGVGLIVVDQQCSSLSKTVFANCATTFCLNQKLRSDVQAIAGALNLTPEQRDAVSTLPVGMAVTRLPEGHPEAFLIKVPPPPPLPPEVTEVSAGNSPSSNGMNTRTGRVSDAELAERFARFNQVDGGAPSPTTEELIARDVMSRRSGSFPGDPGSSPPESAPRTASERITALPIDDIMKKTLRPPPPPRQQPSEPDPDNRPDRSLDPPQQTTSEEPIDRSTDSRKASPTTGMPDPQEEDESLAFLSDLIDHPLSTTVERYDRLHLSRRRGHALRTALVDTGVLRPVRLRTRSGTVVLIELTEQGRQRALDAGLSAPLPPREGLEHRYWADRVARSLRQGGYRVQREYPVSGNGRIDLWATRDGDSLQVEIETGRSSIVTNLTKCVGHADSILLVATNPAARRACAQAVARLPVTQRRGIRLASWLDY